MTARVRTLIVDDEPVARDALRVMLADVPWAELVYEARDGGEALDALREYQPELVFLDVQMPVMSGVEALEQCGISAAVVFTTAHDEAAITAFELGAIDYLKKPFGRERFALAIDRVRIQLAALELAKGGPDTAPIAERLRHVRNTVRPLNRIYVRGRRTIIPIETQDIMRCEADDDYVIVHGIAGSHHAYLNLRDLVAALDSTRFIRIHRSHVVNLDFVASVAHHDPNRAEVTMKDGTRLVASRSGTQTLRARLR
jgi:two-component system LytT family response regulator